MLPLKRLAKAQDYGNLDSSGSRLGTDARQAGTEKRFNVSWNSEASHIHCSSCSSRSSRFAIHHIDPGHFFSVSQLASPDGCVCIRLRQSAASEQASKPVRESVVRLRLCLQLYLCLVHGDIWHGCMAWELMHSMRTVYLAPLFEAMIGPPVFVRDSD